MGGLCHAAQDAKPLAAAAPAPQPQQAELSLTDTVSQHGITWKFEEKVRVGRFVGGDYYVVGPVKIIAVTPPPENGRNGSVLNLPPVNARSGFDDRVAGGRYDAKLAAGLPVSMKPGDALVSSISVTKMRELPAPLRLADRSHSPVRSVAVLTCLAEPAPDDAFRPSYCDRQQRIYLARNLRRDFLPRLPPVEGPPGEAGWVAKADPAEWADRFQRPWIDTCAFNFDVPAEYMPHYGREVGRAVGIASLVLMCDFPAEQKERLLVNFVQYGIDLLGSSEPATPAGRPTAGTAAAASGRFCSPASCWATRRSSRSRPNTEPDSAKTCRPCTAKAGTEPRPLYAGHVGRGKQDEQGVGAYEHLHPSGGRA